MRREGSLKPSPRFADIGYRGLRFAAPALAFALMLPLLGPVRDAAGSVQTSDPGRLIWAWDLAAHWQVVYAVLWLALCLTCALRDRRWLLAAPLALSPLWTASPSLPQAHDDGPVFVVAAANVNHENRDPQRLVAWLRTQPADVVAISELSPAYAQTLIAALGNEYPHYAFKPDHSPFGIGLMSRHPLQDIEPHVSADGIPQLRARIATPHGMLRIVAVHPMPPLAPHWHVERDRLLRMLADEASREHMPTIVAGDLNATPWSTALTGSARHGLRRASGLAPTWNGRYVGIPIDHVLASAHWHRAGDTVRGPDIGSDHRPVRVALRWATPAAQRRTVTSGKHSPDMDDPAPHDSRLNFAND